MEAIESNPKISLHTRTNSFPTAPHPLVSQFEDHLNRLKSSDSSSSSSSLRYKLSGLQDLQDYHDKLLQLSTARQVFAQDCSQKCVDELLDGSLRLLDICSTAKDCLEQSKESVYEVQSAIRRRGAEAAFTVGAGNYLASRKNVKKAVRKTLGNIKEIRNQFIVSSATKEHDMLGMLKEAEAVTVSTLESLLYFISDPKGQSKQSRWSAISKLMQPKRVACDSQELSTNEFEKADTTLKSLISGKKASMDNIQGHLENLEMCIQDLEIKVECLSRKLVRTRVSLLNIFNH
ncbi:uncharacterized protein LOC129292117 [Prosopis cineraria]|uniref:uncharacterized protein LOC129292117 n=1 Tax=Prosopis cineraria TaxID=364024 RepID=UPI00240F46AF|nr:uncharacterized protein LOC129292117 [Prosopis cineraria]